MEIITQRIEPVFPNLPEKVVISVFERNIIQKSKSYSTATLLKTEYSPHYIWYRTSRGRDRSHLRWKVQLEKYLISHENDNS